MFVIVLMDIIQVFEWSMDYHFKVEGDKEFIVVVHRIEDFVILLEVVCLDETFVDRVVKIKERIRKASRKDITSSCPRIKFGQRATDKLTGHNIP